MVGWVETALALQSGDPESVFTTDLFFGPRVYLTYVCLVFLMKIVANFLNI